MRGPTAVMAPAVRKEHSGHSPSGVSRSHSTPELTTSSTSISLDSTPSFELSFDSDFSLDTSFSFSSFTTPSLASSPPSSKTLRTRKLGSSYGARTGKSSSDTSGLTTDKLASSEQVDESQRLATKAASRRRNVDPNEKSRPPVSGNNRRRTGSMIERPRSWLENRLSTDDRPATSVGETGTTGGLHLSADSATAKQPDFDPFRTKRSSWLTVARPPSRPVSPKEPKQDKIDPFTNKRTSWFMSVRPPSRSSSPKQDDADQSTSKRSSWLLSPSLSSSRPSSPNRQANQESSSSFFGKSSPKLQSGSIPTLNPQTRPETAQTTKSSKSGTLFGKFKQKQYAQSGKASSGLESDNSCASSAVSLAPPASNSTVGRVSQATSADSNGTGLTTDESSCETPRLKDDPLLSSLSTLETEYRAFLCRTTAQRVFLVQSVLLPFLRSTANHPSNKEMGADDIERRAHVYHNWWSGILEMLDGSGSQSVPGVDRPPLYDALTLMMTRPEWRQTTRSFLPLSDRSPRERIRSRSYSDSVDSHDHVPDSAEQNVRTMFVGNLLKQMTFAVQKMSNRHVPMSLVQFAGKTCAYAFFFAPGVADILIRLWGPTQDQIKRTADEFGLPRVDKGESEDIVALFPPRLGIFGWRTAKLMAETLKKPPKMTVMIARIHWTGAWMSRWQGRDTDLFYVFCKYFHILSDQFMPPGLPLTEKARSPAFVLVQTQLMATFHTTLRRETAVTNGGGVSLMEMMPGADASAMSMPMGSPSSDAMRAMSENRLVVLLRGFLFDHASELARAKNTFAETFACMLKGAVRKTSQFDSQACFTLCDFLEEVLMLYDEAQGTSDATGYIDWGFWLDVFDKMLKSLNTVTEVRVLSFIFTIWEMISREPKRKERLCIDWLLTEEIFDTFFNHWCPMVRAYYHRLLCWRICRSVNEPDDVDTKIFIVVASRLKKTWSHFLYSKRDAERSRRAAPSTIPMLPTPGKKFMIIRQEVTQPQPGLLVNLDQFSKPFLNDVASPTDAIVEDANGQKGKQDGKKKKSLFQKVFRNESSSPSKEDQKHDAWETEFLKARRDQAQQAEQQAMSKSRPGLSSKIENPGTGNDSDSECSSLVIEEQKYIFRFVLAWYQPPQPLTDRALTRPRLPAPAQMAIQARAQAASQSTNDPRGRTSSMTRSGPVRPRAHSRTGSGSITTTTHARRPGVPYSTASDEPESDTKKPGSSCMSSTLVTFLNEALEPVTSPTKPVGFYARSAAYTGRALAEWGQVAWECNNFVDRRCDEGVANLEEVEVPILGVEGFRRMAG